MSINNSYASKSFWSWTTLSTASQEDIAINGFWLQNSNIITSFISEDNIIDFENFNFPKSNGRGFLWYYKRWKNITLNTTIKASSKEEFQDLLDELRKQIFKSESLLDIRVNWVIRRIKVNCVSSPKILNHYNITFLKLSINFETLEPFFYELSLQTNTFLNKTANFNEEITNQWTDEVFPTTYFQFKTWLSWVNSVQLKINDSTITVNETINDNDILIIDWEDKTVKLNWVDVDYNWVFPFLWITQNILTFTIAGTWSADINVLNKIIYV